MEKGLSFDQNIKSIRKFILGVLDRYLFEQLNDFTLHSLNDSLTQYFNHPGNKLIDNITVTKEDFLKWNLYNKCNRDVYYEFVVKPIYEKKELSSRFNKINIAERYGLI